MTANPRKKAQKWTIEHDEILKSRFHSEYVHDIADDMGFSRSTVQEHARQLGLRKKGANERNHDIKAFVKKEYDNLSYREMARRTRLHTVTIYKIAKELGLSSSRQRTNENIRRARNETIRSERRRIMFGLEQRTNLKVVCNLKKLYLRQKMRQCGYIAARGGNTIYYTKYTVRRPIRERNGRNLGFEFKPLDNA